MLICIWKLSPCVCGESESQDNRALLASFPLSAVTWETNWVIRFVLDMLIDAAGFHPRAWTIFAAFQCVSIQRRCAGHRAPSLASRSVPASLVSSTS